MTTPTYPSKRFYAAAAIKGADWGTALPVEKGILIENDGNPSPKRPYEARDDIDAIMPLDGDLGLIEPVDFSPEFAMRYDPGPLGSLIAGLFGVAGAPTPVFEVVTGVNDKVNVKEGSDTPPELTATVPAGTYTGATLATAIALALNAIQGKTLVWACTYNPTTNKFTLGVTTTICSLLFATGTNHALDISVLCGYAETDLTGSLNYVSDGTGVGVAMKHVFTWADYVEKFFTFAVERPGVVREIPSAVPFKLSLKIAKGLLKGTISLRGNHCVDGGVNGATEMDALTYADVANIVRFGHGAIWMNLQGAGALAVGDVLQISEVDIDYERVLDAYHAAGDEGIIQSQDAKAFKMSIKLTIPRTAPANLAYLASFNSKEAQKLTVAFTSDLNAGGGVKYSLLLGFPRLKFVEPPAAPLADAMSTVITLEAEQAATGPTGMSAYTRPFLELVNLQATDYLA
jgi:hypothetical protein